MWAVPTFWLAAEIVADTDLVTTMPTALAEHFAEVFDLHVDDPPIRLEPLDIAAHWHDRQHGDPRHRWFRAVLADQIEHPGADTR